VRLHYARTPLLLRPAMGPVLPLRRDNGNEITWAKVEEADPGVMSRCHASSLFTPLARQALRPEVLATRLAYGVADRHRRFHRRPTGQTVRAGVSAPR